MPVTRLMQRMAAEVGGAGTWAMPLAVTVAGTDADGCAARLRDALDAAAGLCVTAAPGSAPAVTGILVWRALAADGSDALAALAGCRCHAAVILLPEAGDPNRFEQVAAALTTAGADAVLPDERPARLPAVVTRLAAAARQAADQTLRNRLLTDLVDASPTALSIADPAVPEMPIVFVNKAFTAVTGYGSDAVLGRNCRMLQGADTDPETVETLRRAIAERRIVTVDLLNYRSDGMPFWNRLTVGPFHDRDGALLAFIGTQTDISDERRRAAVANQSQRLESLGRLAGGVAHELNNLIHPMMSFAQIALEDTPETDDRHAALVVIRDTARRMRDVVANTLAFARPRGPAATELDIVAAVRRACMFARQALPSSVDIRLDLPDADLMAGVDATELSQVMLNLMTNAADALGGRGSIAVTMRAVTLDGGDAMATGLMPGGYAEIAVADSGCGIAPAVQERMFDPFFTTKPPDRGTGLGLSIVFGIVTGWRGSVRVDSQPTVGTTMTVSIPLMSADPPSEEATE